MLKYQSMPSKSATAEGIKLYIEHGIAGGSFLDSILRNDLVAVCAHADPENQDLIFYWVSWLYNEAPSECWGSDEKVDAWMILGGIKGIENFGKKSNEE